jgi:hypothetical protein
MEQASLQNYVFREQGDKTWIGGYPVEKIANETQEKYQGGGVSIGETPSNSRLQNLVVPVGLYVSGGRNAMMTGGNGIQVKEIIGGTIDDKDFHKLYDMVATQKAGKQKTKKIHIRGTKVPRNYFQRPLS